MWTTDTFSEILVSFSSLEDRVRSIFLIEIGKKFPVLS